jgi:hypothetical protein
VFSISDEPYNVQYFADVDGIDNVGVITGIAHNVKALATKGLLERAS